MGKKVGLTIVEPVERAKEKFLCPFCSKEYVRQSDLQKHIDREHPNEDEQETQ